MVAVLDLGIVSRELEAGSVFTVFCTGVDVVILTVLLTDVVWGTGVELLLTALLKAEILDRKEEM